MSSLQHALELAAKGFKVFPVPANNKRVVLEDWPNKATTDPAKIRAWFTDYDGDPVDSNIGICTNDLLVIDIEGEAKGGRNPYDVLSDIEAELGPLPHVAETPSGGFHAYLRLPPGAKVANTAKTVWPGVDTRSWHGYVLAPGSAIDGKPYKWLIAGDGKENWPPASIDDLPVAPDHLIAKIGAPKPKADLPSNITYDTPASIDQAIDFLKRTPPAIQGDGGDFTTFKTAARVRDFAVSESVALDLMLDHWNPRCEPPWDPEELQAKVNNAYRYAENTPKEPGSEFEAVEFVQDLHKLPEPFGFHPHGPIDLKNLPQRHWIVEGVAARGFVTLISAPPGSGKTQLIAQLLLAVSHNTAATGFKVHEPTASWAFNAEDDIAELRRRIGAAMIHQSLDWPSRAHDWAISSGVDSPLSIAKWDAQNHKVRINDQAVSALRANILQHHIGLLILDPFADIHDAPESDNDAIKRVMGVFTALAKETNAAIVIATHTRKLPNASSDGHAGNAESVRGASAMVAKARVVLTLMPMSPKEAKAFAIDPRHQGHYMRVDTAKNNLGPTERGAKPLWLKWESVPLPNGDKVGVLAPANIEAAESRVKRERPQGEEFKDTKAQIIADQMEATTGPDVMCMWSDVRSAMGPMGAKGGALVKYATEALGEKRQSDWLPTGDGRRIRFRKGHDGKIRVWWSSSNEDEEEEVAPGGRKASKWEEIREDKAFDLDPDSDTEDREDLASIFE